MKKFFFLLVVALALGLIFGIRTAPLARADVRPGTMVQLPILGIPTAQNEDVDFTIEIQNVGSDFTRAVLFVMPLPSGSCAPQQNPLRWMECTGVLAPGSAWTFVRTQLPVWAQSAIVFSIPGDSSCTNLDSGEFPPAPGSILGTGQPLAVEVVRKGPGLDPTLAVSSAYSGISQEMTGTYDPVYGSFSYYTPLLYAGVRGLNSWLYIQNTGNACTSVEMWFRTLGDCVRAQIADIPALLPGESQAVDVGTLVPPGFQGSAWVRTSQPVAIVVDIIGADLLMTYHGVPSEISYVFNGTPFAPSGSQVLYGPLFFREDQGWETVLAIQNMSSIVNAKVKVIFFDNSGDIVGSLIDWVCPRGSQLFSLAAIDALRGTKVGSIRVESQEWWTPGDPLVRPPNINGVAQLIKLEGPLQTDPLEAIAYNLFPEQQAFTWQVGAGGGGLESGVGVIGIPSLMKRGGRLTTELAILNVVPKPGFTDFALFVYDQNGLIDVVCQKLHENQLDYINLDQWNFLHSGFRGSAVISATFWEHDVFSSTGGFVRNLVGLAAVKVERSGTVLGVDVPGDESGGSEGFPIRSSFEFMGPSAPCQIDSGDD